MKITQNTDYLKTLSNLKAKIKAAQIKSHLVVNKEMLILYWQIGKTILEKQHKEGWGSKIINQLSKDLQLDFPEMKGFSPRNLNYMRKFASEYENYEFVQQVAAKLPWFHLATLMDKVSNRETRLFYINKTIENSWSRNTLITQIQSNDQPSIGLILCKSKNNVLAEYALRDMSKPIGLAEYRITEALPKEIKTNLPTIKELEAELKKETK